MNTRSVRIVRNIKEWAILRDSNSMNARIKGEEMMKESNHKNNFSEISKVQFFLTIAHE